MPSSMSFKSKFSKMFKSSDKSEKSKSPYVSDCLKSESSFSSSESDSVPEKKDNRCMVPKSRFDPYSVEYYDLSRMRNW